MSYSRRELNKEKSRGRILKASRKLFSTKGYEDTMIEDIAVKAEVSKATVYNYFPNKESLLIGIAQEVLERVADLLRNDLADCADSLQKLKRVLEVFVQASLKYPSLSRRITCLNSQQDSTLFATRQEMTEILRGLIVAAQQEGQLRADADAEDMTDVVMGIYLMAQFQWANLGPDTPELLQEKLNRVFAAMMATYLSPGPRGV